ncbi:glycine cleavage system aminomethyltransferase GcvT [Denitrobaculum tricleocarpae]|uniref:aminomethyltransferase n=1 Tax=Denitrobaculum tricleocarpae TaxID=2591009 RepID=A0A545U1Y3_9PROT|nr:glycine cleavage system aminomethyltransferase GcvT [Denitrobaculum tricleocarpae]TQV83481.1 glycine cleavage system aminomethyltransferase GcvT [Denitrobaculum tricleocarpae]
MDLHPVLKDRTVTDQDSQNKKTALYALHVELGGKMVPFAGYMLPVQYADAGIMLEHQRARESAALFDVSHMGQVRITGADRVAALEALVPADVETLAVGRTRYSFFTNETGGILDDLMITQAEDGLILVINAACKDADIAHLRANLSGDVKLEVLDSLSLLALQGPGSAAVLGQWAPEATTMPFMSTRDFVIAGIDCRVSRSGYSGEDGYEIAMESDRAVDLARALLEHDAVSASGLGARDSLRLEAGLCLYGHDIDTTTTPVEAGLTWAMQKRRRTEGGFPGAAVIQKQLADGAPRRLVGLKPEGRAPCREGTELTDDSGRVIGKITSGGFGPTVGGPVAMGYLETAFASAGTTVQAMVRGKPRPCEVVKMPFVAHSFYRG